MSSDFKNSLDRELLAQVIPAFPEFQQAKPFHQNVALLLERSSSGGTRLFIVIATPIDREEFTVEIAWTHKADYPADVKIQSPFLPSGEYKSEALAGSCFRLRADRLWGMRRDFWWRSEPTASLQGMLIQMEQAARHGEDETKRTDASRSLNVPLNLERARPDSKIVPVADLVRDAVEKIKVHVLPYFALVENGNQRK